jgi:hypothetical protein
MRSFGIFIILFMVFFRLIDTVSAQNVNKSFNPKVFFMGENDQDYSVAIAPYGESLLSVSNDSMETAYLNWMYLLKDIEDFSKKNNFDLNGLKIWINVFWNKNGRIDIISYYPKPNCRNIEFEKLSLFLVDFIKQYKPRLKYKSNFSHYGSARFPSFADMYINQGK